MRKLILLGALAGCAAAAWSQAPAVQAEKRGTGNDPNEIVCVNEAEIGSRLAKRRVCRTRAQWEQHQRETRLAVDKAQQQMGSQGE